MPEALSATNAYKLAQRQDKPNSGDELAGSI